MEDTFCYWRIRALRLPVGRVRAALRVSPLLLLLLLCTSAPAPYSVGVRAQNLDRDLRAVWMATVLNIDYPQNATADATTLKADFDSQLYRLRRAGMNAIFVQVRPAGDAIYPSQYAPWSAYLTGEQGKAPVSDFDPLAYMVDRAHAYGVELHAWVNPYRVAMTLDSVDKAPNHLLNTHPEWVRSYGGRRYLDPGLPEVRAHLGLVLDELLDNYDLDGIHFDDYFYPYPSTGEAFPDRETFASYGGSRRLSDWRRDNVNIFVAETHQRIKAKKPWVHFGISPFGVWRNQSQDPLRGSATHASVSSYDDLYGDALAWAEQGTVDYLLPQLYWSMDFPAASYRVLANWWSANTPASVLLYAGHAAYKVNDNADEAWKGLEEIPRQVAFNRKAAAIKGSVYFSAKSILRNPAGVARRMAEVYPELSLLPARKAPQAPRPVKVKLYRPKAVDGHNQVVWEVDKKLPAEEMPHYFAIYRGATGQGAKLVHRTPLGLKNCRRFHYNDTEVPAEKQWAYKVFALDRYHRVLNEVSAR